MFYRVIEVRIFFLNYGMNTGSDLMFGYIAGSKFLFFYSIKHMKLRRKEHCRKKSAILKADIVFRYTAPMRTHLIVNL